MKRVEIIVTSGKIENGVGELAGKQLWKVDI